MWGGGGVGAQSGQTLNVVQLILRGLNILQLFLENKWGLNPGPSKCNRHGIYKASGAIAKPRVSIVRLKHT